VKDLLNREIEKISETIAPIVVEAAKESSSYFNDAATELPLDKVSSMDIQDVLVALERDFEHCHTNADVKSIIQVQVMKHNISDITFTDESEIGNSRIEIVPFDYIPLHTDEVATLMESLRTKLEGCSTRAMLISIIACEIKSMVSLDRAKKRNEVTVEDKAVFEDAKPVAMKEDLEVAVQRIYELETENSLLRMSFNDYKASTTSALAYVTAQLTALSAAVEGKADKAVFESTTERLKREVVITDRRIDELRVELQKLDYSSVKTDDVEKLFDNV